MRLEDPRGLDLTAGSAAGLERYEAALDDVLSFHGDPIGAADAALDLDPRLVSAHLLKAHTFAFSLHPGLLPKAEACLDVADAPGGIDRERSHQVAARA